MPEIIRTVSGMQRRSAAWRAEGLRIGLVPTMGALHEGHLDLVRRARATTDRIIVSIFVNPTQFAPTEDFAAYPRDEASDLDKLAALGVEAVFAPTVPEMYPAGYATRISVEGPARGLESDARPHFFGGVATVVAKLFIACAPDDAIFGEKDYQQLAVVRRMAADLGLPVAVVTRRCGPRTASPSPRGTPTCQPRGAPSRRRSMPRSKRRPRRSAPARRPPRLSPPRATRSPPQASTWTTSRSAMPRPSPRWPIPPASRSASSPRHGSGGRG